MSRVFADACYWIALINREDELRAAALAAQKNAIGSVAVSYTHLTLPTNREV